MYYLIETKDKTYRIVDNITDIKTKESSVYKYCLENNIQMKASKKDIRLSGMYCIPKNDYTYTIYHAENDGWVYKGKIIEQYELMFIHYVVTDGDKYKLNDQVKSHKLINIKLGKPKA